MPASSLCCVALEVHDIARLSDWLPRQSWPYHRHTSVDSAWVEERARSGYFFGPDVRAFWAIGADSEPIGLVRLFDLGDITPLVDLRLGDAHRGRGLGAELLRFVTDFAFDDDPRLRRVGGYTRHDNHPMCRVFDKCGFVREAQHRQAWPLADGAAADALGYAMLRDDWDAARARLA